MGRRAVQMVVRLPCDASMRSNKNREHEIEDDVGNDFISLPLQLISCVGDGGDVSIAVGVAETNLRSINRFHIKVRFMQDGYHD